MLLDRVIFGKFSVFVFLEVSAFYKNSKDIEQVSPEKSDKICTDTFPSIKATHFKIKYSVMLNDRIFWMLSISYVLNSQLAMATNDRVQLDKSDIPDSSLYEEWGKMCRTSNKISSSYSRLKICWWWSNHHVSTCEQNNNSRASPWFT